jgi:hypothetical protein
MFPELFQVLNSQTGVYLWFMHEFARPRYALTFRAFFNNEFPDTTGEAAAWPASSSDLNKSDFHL